MAKEKLVKFTDDLGNEVIAKYHTFDKDRHENKKRIIYAAVKGWFALNGHEDVSEQVLAKCISTATIL